MAKLQEYACRACGKNYEFLHHPSNEPAACPSCGSLDAELQLGGAPLLTVIVPVYPGCKKHKAGFVHSHGDKPAEKNSVQVPTTFKGEST
jgi:putative FmdB family regulatory protein